MLSWVRFVDLITVVWLSLFALGYAAPEFREVIDPVLTGLTAVFVLDLVRAYREVGSLGDLLRRKWLDVVLLIPFFRFLRLFRVVRAVRAVKVARSARSVRTLRGVKNVGFTLDYAEKAHQTVKFVKKVRRVLRLLRRRA